MRYILARGTRDVLKQFGRSRVLLAFDYDGTLAPIVPDPARAAMRASTRALLERIAERYPCMVISGRSRADARRRLRGARTVEVVGNHGIEPWQTSTRSLQVVQRWRPVLARALARWPDVTVEDKGYSLAVHYRRSREKKNVRVAIDRVVSRLGEVRIIRGKQVVNLLPEDAPHKGVALEKARSRFGCDTAIYVGDDRTDEDVFGLDQPGQLLTVRVGKNSDSRAAYYLRDQREIDRFLRVLLAVRPPQRHTSVESCQ
jgi:trehalose 6-phosphate phosphatase